MVERDQFLRSDDRADLQRLDDLFEDGEGWDLPKERMKRLAELGVVRHHGGGHYSITSFGRWVLGSWHSDLPLQTVAEVNEASSQRMLAAISSPARHTGES